MAQLCAKAGLVPLITAILFLCIFDACSQALAPDVAMAPSAALGRSIPVLTIPARVELPKLPLLEDNVNLTMDVAIIRVSDQCSHLMVS